MLLVLTLLDYVGNDPLYCKGVMYPEPNVDPELDVSILYNTDDIPVGYRCVRKGYKPIECGFTKDELSQALEECRLPKRKSIKEQEFDKQKKVKLEQELREMNEKEAAYKNRLVAWERLPWWKKIITERPHY